MKLMDVYQKLSGATGAEKTAAEGQDPVDSMIDALGLKGEIKTAQDKDVVKLAAHYLQMGADLARDTFAKEIAALDKTAAEAEPKKEVVSEKPAAEKTAAEKPEAKNDVESLLSSIGIGSEKTASDKASADLKEGALRELVAVHLIPASKSGSAKATAALKKIAASGEKGLAVVTEAVKNGEAVKAASAGSLAKYLAAKKGETK